MKTILAIIGLAVCLAADAQTYKSRPPTPQEQRKLAGITEYVQDVFYRDHIPTFITPGVLYYPVTNAYEGTIFAFTNLNTSVHIALPNPTNNIGRKFTLNPLGACTLVLSNIVSGTITSGETMAVATTYSVASNRTAVAYSTGTNYIAFLR